LQTCEKFGIDPWDWFYSEKWLTDKGDALKNLCLAYHQVLAEEEARIKKEMEKKTVN
jgi:hypothetical protein